MKLFTAHIRDSVMSGTGRQGQGVSDRENDKGAVTGRGTRGDRDRITKGQG